MPTNPQITFSASRLDPLYDADDAMDSLVDVALKGSSTYLAGTVVGEISASPGTYDAYAHSNEDGTENPKGILQYGAVTDSDGNIVDSEWGTTRQATPMYTKGAFRIQDLSGYDQYVAPGLGGHEVENDGSGNGIVTF